MTDKTPIPMDLSATTRRALGHAGIETEADAREALAAGMRPDTGGIVMWDTSTSWRVISQQSLTWRPFGYGETAHKELCLALDIARKDLEVFDMPGRIYPAHIEAVIVILKRRGFSVTYTGSDNES